MPNVTAAARPDQNGQATTYFIDTVGTTSTDYTYPSQQSGLVITNRGNSTITLTVNGTPYTIQGGSSQAVNQQFTVFTIVAASASTTFDALAVANINQFQLTGRKAQQTEILGASGVLVANGTDFMAATDMDLSQANFIQYIYFTSGAGAGTANIFLYAVDGSGNSRVALKSTIGSNDSLKRALTGPADVRAYPKVTFGFRNADTVAVTAYLKVCTQV